MWELQTGKILVFDNTCHKCDRIFKSPKMGYHICPDCMSESAVKVVLTGYNDIACDRVALTKQVKRLKEILELFIQ